MMLDVGSWMLEVGCWKLDVGSWKLDVRKLQVVAILKKLGFSLKYIFDIFVL